MRFFLLVIFVLLINGSTTAQYRDIDSLKYQIVEDSPDSTRFRLYTALSDAYQYVNIDTSILYADLALELARQNQWETRQVEGLNNLGFKYLDSGQNDKCQPYFMEGIRLSAQFKDTALMAMSANGLGLSYWQIGRNDEALRHLQNAFAWAEAGGDVHMKGRVLNNMGMICGDLGRSEKAIEYFERVAEIAKIVNSEKGLGIAAINIATEYSSLGEYDKAIKYFKDAGRIFHKVKDYHGVVLTKVNMAHLYIERNDPQKALAFAEEAKELSLKYSINDVFIFSLTEKSNALLSLNRYDAAIAEAKEGIKKAMDMESTLSLMDLYPILSKALEGKKLYSESLFWQRKYSSLADSLHESNREKDIAQLEISFQSKQKEAENKLLLREKDQQAIIIQQRTSIAIAVGMGLLLLSIVAVLLFYARRKARSLNIFLEEKVKQRTEELEQLNEHLTQSNEELQRFAFIASHDLKEPLRNMGGFISLIKRRLKKHDDQSLTEYLGFVERSNEQMVHLVDNVLEFSKLDSFNAASYEKVNLKAILDDIEVLLVDPLEGKKVQILYDSLPDQIMSNPAMIRILLKNLIDNGIKYNKSKTPIIKIYYKELTDLHQLIVEDNGIGIAPEYHHKIFEMFGRLHHRGAYTGSGMGLAFCKKILSKVGGTITVESEEGKGARFIITFPRQVFRTNRTRMVEKEIGDLRMDQV